MNRIYLYLKIILNLLIVILGGVFALVLLPKLIRFFLPFVIGWIIALIANPLVRFMEKRVKIVRKHSSAIIIVLVIGIVVAVLYGVGYFAVTQINSLMSDFPTIAEIIEEQFDIVSEKFEHVYNVLPSGIQTIFDGLVVSTKDYLSDFGGESSFQISMASEFAKNVIEICLMTIITILSSYFFIAERDNLTTAIKAHMPEAIIRGYGIVAENMKKAFGGYFKAQLKIMVILIFIMFVGFEAMRIGYSFLLALIIAILDFLPFLGTGVILWPWAIVEAVIGNFGKTIFLLVIYLICQIVKQVLQPKMVGDSVGINPLATLFFMYVGYRFYGVLGMIIGIPIGLVLIKFYQLGFFDNLVKGFKLLIQEINEFRKF